MDHGTGRAGEDHIAQLLRQRGWEIVKQNFHCRFGEIDIIAQDRQYLVFVEVKTREKGSLAHPLEAITPAKQRKVLLAAQVYLTSHPTALQPRFDAAAVYTEDGKIVGETYLENAFGQ